MKVTLDQIRNVNIVSRPIEQLFNHSTDKSIELRKIVESLIKDDYRTSALVLVIKLMDINKLRKYVDYVYESNINKDHLSDYVICVNAMVTTRLVNSCLVDAYNGGSSYRHDLLLNLKTDAEEFERNSIIAFIKYNMYSLIKSKVSDTIRYGLSMIEDKRS